MDKTEVWRLGGWRNRGRSVAGLAAATVLLGAAPAAASGWHQVTPSGGMNIDEVALLRSADGNLHVAWVQKDAANPAAADIATRTVNRTGTGLGPVSEIASGWAAVSNPSLSLAPGGLRAFFGGIRTINAGEPNDDLNTATSVDGQSWTLQVGNASNGADAYASSVSATALPDLTPVTAWGSSAGTFTATGTSPGPVYNLQAQLGGDFGYDPGLATSATGVPYVAWASNATGKSGVWAQPLHADGTPAAPPQLMPGILGSGFSQQLQRTPIAARPGGGVYVAYPGGYPASTRVVLWRVGDSSARTVFHGAGDHHVTLSATGDGRIWVVWSDQTGRLYAVRSNRTVTAFGAVVPAGAPGAATTYSVDASAAPDGGVDVFALSGAGGTATFQKRLLPGLSLRARRMPSRGQTTAVSFTVLDAGDPVTGALVSVLGHTARTGRSGRVTLRFSAGARRVVAARATRPGYVAGTATVRIAAH